MADIQCANSANLQQLLTELQTSLLLSTDAAAGQIMLVRIAGDKINIHQHTLGKANSIAYHQRHTGDWSELIDRVKRDLQVML